MNHVAVDLGARQSQFCVRLPDGQVQQEGKVPTRQLAGVFRALPKSRVVLETCAETFAVVDMATAAGHEVSVVPASLAPSLGVGQRGVKTDKRDAQNLSMASCRMERLPSVHVPTMATRELRALLTSRGALVRSRTMLVNSVRGWLRTQLLKPKTGNTSTLPQRVRDVALQREEGLPMHIDRMLKMVELLNEQIKESDDELVELTEKDLVCQQLMTTPGVGPVTAASFRAAVDEVRRFSSAHALESYLGLTPGERSSGDKTNRLGITGAGCKRTRTALVQAAWSAYRCRPMDPMVKWARQLAERKPVQVAITALARKLAGILYAMWRDGTTYTPQLQR
jgi:transposase